MNIPLAERLRPKAMSEWVGQEHLQPYLDLVLKNRQPHSLLLFGPPGCGKTTLARIYAASFELPLHIATAVFQSSTELKKLLKQGQETPLFSRQIILFVDEIHRFNRAQQDLFLPFLEDGSLILIGATTENPSFVLNNALLSRLRVLTLNPLNRVSLEKILERCESLFGPLPIDTAARDYLLELAQGDARHLLNLVETIQAARLQERVDSQALALLLQRRLPLYDKHQEGHYNLISALHKSIRGSDPDAALYWLARMLNAGEEPLFLARRLIRTAVEDIGLADPQALQVALAGRQTYEVLGSPEGDLALAQVAVYLALAPKSNALYTGFDSAIETASRSGHLDPPPIILNAPTKLMKEMGYGKGYLYDHDVSNAFSGQDYFPSALGRQSFYFPVERGFEREMKRRMDYFSKLRCLRQTSSGL